MRLLVAREHGRVELCRKLIDRELDAQVVEDVVAELADEGLQSDERFAGAYARSRAARGFGSAVVIYELKGRGLASAVIDRALAQLEVDWQDIASAALNKKFGSSKFKADTQSKMRRYLYSRGFDAEQASAAVRRMCTDLQN